MMNAFRLINGLPSAARLFEALKRARDGDQDSLAYLKEQGWADALELWQPGSGELGKQLLHQVKDAGDILSRTMRGELADPQTRVPWGAFLNRLLDQGYGAHIILGMPGTGKTTLAKRLALRCAEAQGYTIETVNMFPEDIPEGASVIDMDTLVKRMAKLRAYLRSTANVDIDDADGAEPEPSEPVGLPPIRRVVVIDEAILSMTVNAMDPGRRAALQAMAQCRHLNWIVIYIGQWAGQLPLALLGQACVWVKEPQGREALTDRDEPMVRDLWERAGAGFKRLSDSNWYIKPWLDRRSWAYVDCQSLNGERGHNGMVPFSMPGVSYDAEPQIIDAESWKEVED